LLDLIAYVCHNPHTNVELKGLLLFFLTFVCIVLSFFLSFFLKQHFLDAINMIAPFILRPPKSKKAATTEQQQQPPQQQLPTDAQQQHRRCVEQINHMLWVLAFNRNVLFEKILLQE